MPIYAYRCESCGFEKDVLQKMSDAPLTQCPECKSEAFRKQVTAAGFQLKGSGWYVTDFRGGSKGAGAAANGQKDSGESKTASGDSGTATGTASSASATSAASTGGSGSSGSTGSGTAASSTADA